MSTLRRALAAAALASTASCVLVLGMDPLSEGTAAVDDGGTRTESGAPADGGPTTPDACAPVEMPAPIVDDAGAAPVYFVMTSIDIEAGADGVGFDLDGLDTPTNAASCAATPEVFADHDGGVDNAIAHLLNAFARNFDSAFASDDFDRRLREGRFGVVLRVQDWNGTPDDPQVRVAVIPTIAFALRQGGTFVRGTRGDAGEFIPGRLERFGPNYDAGDRPVPDGEYERRGYAETTNASVSAGRLSASFDRDVPIPVRADNRDLSSVVFLLRDARISAVVSDGGRVLLDGRLGGRADTATFLRTFGHVRVDPGVTYLCNAKFMGFSAAEQLRSQVCPRQDIRQSRCDDKLDRPCDALSFGIRFTAGFIDEIAPADERLASDYVNTNMVLPALRCDAALTCP